MIDDDLESGHNERTLLGVAIDDYLEYHRVNKSSAYTIGNYKIALLPFAEWLASSTNVVYVDQLRVKHLRSYVSHLQTTPTKKGFPLADSSISQYALRLSVFCHWLEDEGMISKGMFGTFNTPQHEVKFIPALTHEEFLKLLSVCDEGNKDNPRLSRALTSRNRAIVNVLFDAGIRRSELVGLRLGDIDRTMRLLYVKRKGNKWQQVPISYEGFKPLHEYITKHRPYLASLGVGAGSKKDDPVFLSSRGTPLTINGVTRLFIRLRERSGIVDKPVYSHQGRRFMATSQLDAGRNPLDVQRQMGHTTLTMTNRYYSQSVEGLSKSHEMFSPTRKRSDESRSSGLGSGYYES